MHLTSLGNWWKLRVHSLCYIYRGCLWYSNICRRFPATRFGILPPSATSALTNISALPRTPIAYLPLYLNIRVSRLAYAHPRLRSHFGPGSAARMSIWAPESDHSVLRRKSGGRGSQDREKSPFLYHGQLPSTLMEAKSRSWSPHRGFLIQNCEVFKIIF